MTATHTPQLDWSNWFEPGQLPIFVGVADTPEQLDDLNAAVDRGEAAELEGVSQQILDGIKALIDAALQEGGLRAAHDLGEAFGVSIKRREDDSLANAFAVMPPITTATARQSTPVVAPIEKTTRLCADSLAADIPLYSSHLVDGTPVEPPPIKPLMPPSPITKTQHLPASMSQAEAPEFSSPFQKTIPGPSASEEIGE